MVYGEPSIDDFEFIKPLTSGGFGKVYLGEIFVCFFWLNLPS